jgi:predicted metal-dependent peptidase
MAIDQTKAKEYATKLLTCRMRLLSSHSFYGLLLAHTKFALDEKCETAYTDGKRIAFSPEFLESLSDEETEFVLMHEILHIALKHCLRGHDYNQEAFNIACDIVVNSNILKSFGDNYRRISIGGEPLMHLAPNGNPGHMYTAEEVYDMLPKEMKRKNGGSTLGGGDGNNSQSNSSQGSDNKNGKGNKASGGGGKNQKGKFRGGYFVFDDHSFWTNDENIQDIDAWDKHFEDACKIVSIEDPSNSCGSLPAFAERILKERKKAQTNWREVLDNFVQEEINDYSFNPPDRRFSDSIFMLPDLNEPTETVKNVLFMIDTSGSMSDDMISQAFQEIRGAIEQFGGKLEGYLGFFDAVVVPPVPFSTVEELDIIRLYGGGGTRFDIIFDYVKKEMKDEMPTSIVILTDGYAPFPKEDKAMGIPVLWVINNDDVVPPWGKHTVITIE